MSFGARFGVRRHGSWLSLQLGSGDFWAMVCCFVNCTVDFGNCVPKSRATAPLPPEVVEGGGARPRGTFAFVA